MFIIIFICTVYVDYSLNSDYLSSQYDIFFATLEKVQPGAQEYTF